MLSLSYLPVTFIPVPYPFIPETMPSTECPFHICPSSLYSNRRREHLPVAKELEILSKTTSRQVSHQCQITWFNYFLCCHQVDEEEKRIHVNVAFCLCISYTPSRLINGESSITFSIGLLLPAVVYKTRHQWTGTQTKSIGKQARMEMWRTTTRWIRGVMLRLCRQQSYILQIVSFVPLQLSSFAEISFPCLFIGWLEGEWLRHQFHSISSSDSFKLIN